MRAVHALIACTLLLAACQVPTPIGPKAAEPAARKPAARATPSPAAVATSAAKPDTGLLVRPATAARALHGHVHLDAAYMLATGAGSLIGADAASLVGNNGNTLIGNNGNTLVGNNGNTLVGNNGNTLIGADVASAVAVTGSPLIAAGTGNAIAPARLSADGASLIGNNGNTLVGLDAASLVGADAASLVGNNGNTLIGNNGNTYTLAAAGTSLRAGQQLPAAGMLVAAVSLATGKPVPVGRDAAGEPVYAVYTDAAGNYAIFPPAEARGNLRIVALAASSADQRLRYGVFATEGGAGERNVSEAASLAASYVVMCVRQVFDGFLRKSITTRIENTIAEAEAMGVSTPEMQAMRRIERIAAEIGYETWPKEADRQALLRRIVDIGLAGVVFDDLKSLTGEPAMPVLEAMLTKTEAEVAALMASPPADLTAQTMFDAVSTLKGTRILRPSDYNDFVITKIIAPDPLDTPRIVERINVLRLEIGLDVKATISTELSDASYGIASDIGTRMLAPDPVTGAQPTADAIEAAMQAFVPGGR